MSISQAKSSSFSLGFDSADEVERVFTRFDANGDGRISAAELAGVMRALGSEVSPEELAAMMAEMDSDGDGFVDLAEFAAFQRRRSVDGRGEEAELRDAFEMYDMDQNGLISAKELHQVLTRLGEKCSVKDCTRMIRSVDSDGDGSVSFEEFKKMMSRGAGSCQSKKHSAVDLDPSPSPSIN